ncbi:hypothetical protein [Roseateles toxinivorans]|uniref:Methyl-accepting chemotaxis protein (MCP) signaling protein n=1 Tax=Roseateles toxinivorans TaxID=270368 RepID=A0A4R6QS84_9BURK|nr:hypothetical protein [Roseateles toxinivorans]TDP74490.1 methyl-accepting chemotaxis protein (MCP) signaling protein [Roseateles toxinivorans]
MRANAPITQKEFVFSSMETLLSDLITAITGASREQTIGIAQVGRAVDQLDEVAQRSAAMVEQSGAAANTTSERAQRLMGAVRVYA